MTSAIDIALKINSPSIKDLIVTLNLDGLKLGPREKQVYSMLAVGISVTEIGERLFRSVKTISTHRTRILERLELKNNFEVMLHALKNRHVLIVGINVEEPLSSVDDPATAAQILSRPWNTQRDKDLPQLEGNWSDHD